MAIKTFINGQENGVITFKGDTEPCSVYVNGEKQDNLSYYGVDVTGENSVTYESEYKKNIRTMKADGNTFQQTYGGYQLLQLNDSIGSKTDSEGNVLSWEVKDGIVTVNGTSNVFTTINVNYTKATNSKFKAGTYTYTPYYYKELGDIGMTGCDWQFGDKYFGNSITGFTSKIKGLETKTFEHDWSFGYCALYINANTQYDNYQYAPAILKGEYATLADLPPFEPYVGGIPSPNAGQTYEVQNKVESLNAKDYTYYSDGNDYIYVTQEPIALTEGISYEIDAQYAGAGTPPSDFTLGVAQTREDFFASQGNPLNVTWLITNGTPTGNKPVLEAPFYIGVGSTNTPVTDKDVYINALYDYFIVFFNSYSKVTIPAFPQPIEKANDSKLPSGYQQVEYIESTDTQYIDTGVIPTIDTTVEAKVIAKSYDKFIYGSRTSTTSTDKHCVLLNSNTSLVYGQIGNSSTASSALATNNTNIYTVKNGKDGFYINGALIRNYGSVTFGTSTLPMYLFALNTPAEATSHRGFVGNIYSCKIYDGNTLIRDFIPCYRIADNVIGMYDLVNGVFYENQGTGEFSKGENVGMNLVNTGYNLLNKEEFSSEALRNETEYSGYGNSVLDTEQVQQMLKPSTKYTISYEVEGVMDIPDGSVVNNGCGFLLWNKELTTSRWARANSYPKLKGEIISYSTVFTTPADLVGWHFRAYEYRISIDGKSTSVKCIIRNVQIVEGTEALPYAPYFKNEIPIPASVTKKDGTVVELRMGKISTTIGANEYVATDYLTVDRLANKVLYHQNIGKATLTKDKNWSIYTYNGKQFFFCRDNLGAKRNYNPILADKYFGYATMGEMLQRDYGITTDAVWWGVDYRLSLRDIRFDNVDDFKANLEQNPIEIEYGLAEEITHDITDTDLGQALLNLATQNQQNTITITSEPSISALNVNYAKWGGTINANTNT